MTNRYGSVGIGLETLFSRLDALQDSTATNYPPFNIVQVEDGVHTLEIALAGFSREDVEVVTERNVRSFCQFHSIFQKEKMVLKGERYRLHPC